MAGGFARLATAGAAERSFQRGRRIRVGRRLGRLATDLEIAIVVQLLVIVLVVILVIVVVIATAGRRRRVSARAGRIPIIGRIRRGPVRIHLVFELQALLAFAQHGREVFVLRLVLETVQREGRRGAAQRRRRGLLGASDRGGKRGGGGGRGGGRCVRMIQSAIVRLGEFDALLRACIGEDLSLPRLQPGGWAANTRYKESGDRSTHA
jgi:hypothetical protein